MSKSKSLRIALAVVVLAVGYWMKSQEKQDQQSDNTNSTIVKDSSSNARTSSPNKRSNSSRSSHTNSMRGDSGTTVRSLFRAKKSDVVVEVDATVKFTLPDDLEGSKHQQFVAVFGNNHTVKVAHNIDLAPRVPLKKGDKIEMRGEYEWTEKGGVIHWTHHDPGGRRPGGWIKHNGKTYK